jgi:hypothetical protein
MACCFCCAVDLGLAGISYSSIFKDWGLYICACSKVAVQHLVTYQVIPSFARVSICDIVCTL